MPTARPPRRARIDGPPGPVGVGARTAQCEPVTGAVGPERGCSGQYGIGLEQLEEVAEGGPTDLELDPPHLGAGSVSVTPDEVPPVGSLERHFGRLVVETGTDALGPSRTEGEPGHDVAVLVGRAAVTAAHEGTAVLGAQLHSFHVHEQVQGARRSRPVPQRTVARGRRNVARFPRARPHGGTRPWAGCAPTAAGGWP